MLKGLLNKVRRGSGSADTSHAAIDKLFPKTDPVIDGDDCLQDCETCTIKYPAKFDTEMKDKLYGEVKGWETHLIVATGKTDWVRDVEDEKESIMEAVVKGDVKPGNGRLKISASNMPTHHETHGTRVLLLPSFIYVDHVTPSNTPHLIEDYITPSTTNTSPFSSLPPPFAVSMSPPSAETPRDKLFAHRCPHRYLILLCSHKTRDARCGQSAPLLRREFERHLRPLGLYRDLNDERPGGVGIYFINHVGGHKYSANCIIYRREDALGTGVETPAKDDTNGNVNGQGNGESQPEAERLSEAAQCIWLARVRPADCENIVRYTVLQGKVVKPELQLRGGFDRGRGLVSW